MRVRGSGFRVQIPALAMFLLAGVVFCTGITWGLPSRAVDRYLFGDRSAWSGEKIQQLAGGWSADPGRGADVDLNPLAGCHDPVPRNETDAQRAEIIRRYRLYTCQPDEMITLRALAGMKPGAGRLDPRLYQYGGLWIYPVGALLKLASVAGLVTLKPDVAWYLDHPEEFGRFYVVARLYTVAWGLIGLWAVYWIARRLAGGAVLVGVSAGLGYTWMPVVINMAHEGKPHLPGAVLQLLAVMAAMRYVESGRRVWWIVTGVLCGAAFGMVLSAWPVFVVLPLMVWLRPQSRSCWEGPVVGGALIGAATYLLTNPYIAINLFINREVLRSNFGNSLAMYAIGRWPEGVVNAARLVAEGASLTAAIIGALAMLIGIVRYLVFPRGVADGSANSAAPWGEVRDWLLLAAPVAVILLQFIALAAGKPGEYGRFAVLPDVVLGLAAVVGVSRMFQKRAGQAIGLTMFLCLVIVPGYVYLSAFLTDSRAGGSRLAGARLLDLLSAGGARTLAVYAEPAPYGLPPVNLWEWRVILLPKDYRIEDADLPIDAVVKAVDDYGPTEEPPEGYMIWTIPREARVGHDISWANKPFAVWVRRSLLPTDTAPGT